jgi:hypothetical protein
MHIDEGNVLTQRTQHAILNSFLLSMLSSNTEIAVIRRSAPCLSYLRRAGEVLNPDGDLDHFSNDELMTISSTKAVVRFSEAGYYRSKVLFVEYAGWASFTLNWKPPGAAALEVVPRRSLFAMHPGLGVPVAVLTNRVPAAAGCDAGSVDAVSLPAVTETGLGGVRVRSCCQMTRSW